MVWFIIVYLSFIAGKSSHSTSSELSLDDLESLDIDLSQIDLTQLNACINQLTNDELEIDDDTSSQQEENDLDGGDFIEAVFDLIQALDSPDTFDVEEFIDEFSELGIDLAANVVSLALDALGKDLADFVEILESSGADLTNPFIAALISALTANPTTDPTSNPTTMPTSDPTIDPTNDPSKDPTTDPTSDPTNDPSSDPTKDPTLDPTSDPTFDPTSDPSNDPTNDPTRDPTNDPTHDPTNDPTNDPTHDPTFDPTDDPTNDPTHDPTADPTYDPTYDPTLDPTNDPTNDPSVDPTRDPTKDPTIDPTSDPTGDPTYDPTIDPTNDPTNDPTQDPTAEECACFSLDDIINACTPSSNECIYTNNPPIQQQISCGNATNNFTTFNLNLVTNECSQNGEEPTSLCDDELFPCLLTLSWASALFSCTTNETVCPLNKNFTFRASNVDNPIRFEQENITSNITVDLSPQDVDGLTLSDIIVTMSIRHTRIGDVFATLSHGNIMNQALFGNTNSNSGECNSDNIVVTLTDNGNLPADDLTDCVDDEGNNVNGGDALGFGGENDVIGFGGDRQPLQPLNDFIVDIDNDINNVNGEWILSLSDDTSGSIGFLGAWQLILVYENEQVERKCESELEIRSACCNLNDENIILCDMTQEYCKSNACLIARNNADNLDIVIESIFDLVDLKCTEFV